MTGISGEEPRLYASVDAGFIGRTFICSALGGGRGTVFRGAVDCPKLARALRLPYQQFVTLAQTVG